MMSVYVIYLFIYWRFFSDRVLLVWHTEKAQRVIKVDRQEFMEFSTKILL